MPRTASRLLLLLAKAIKAIWSVFTDFWNTSTRIWGTVEGSLLSEYGGAAAAYSLRILSASTTNVVKVRRSGDDAELDFTANEVSGGTLEAWVVAGGGTKDGFVTTWYDQSGNGNNATQATAANQPKIVSSGTLVEENSKAVIDFDGADDLLTITAGSSILPSTGDLSSFSVFSGDTSTIGYIYSNATSSDDRHGIGLQFFSGALRINGAIRVGGTWNIYEEQLISADQQYLLSAFKSGVDFYVDGIKSTGGTNGVFAAPNITFNIGANTNSASTLNGKLQEIIFFDSDQSTNRTGIEANINDYYNIYP